ncbi:MAG: hypothetical protein LBV67_12735 [Streptococcaceae bacterium]|jgi:fatty acid desaturase|nr:hypothetical protein [Streptococcaceae bacterium]
MVKFFDLKKGHLLARIFELIAFILAVLEILLILGMFFGSAFFIPKESAHLLLLARIMIVGFLLIFLCLFISTIGQKKKKVKNDFDEYKYKKPDIRK